MENHSLPNNHDLQKLGDALKTARIQNGFTQGELADRLIVTQSTISKIERGAYNISFTALIEYCTEMECKFQFKVKCEKC